MEFNEFIKQAEAHWLRDHTETGEQEPTFHEYKAGKGGRSVAKSATKG
jgi:hypothetical protein